MSTSEDPSGDGTGSAPAPETPPVPRTPKPQVTRDYVVYEETTEGIVVAAEGVTASNPEDACWAVVEGEGSGYNERAIAAGAGEDDAAAPRLAAASGGLRFEDFVLEPEQKLKRVRR